MPRVHRTIKKLVLWTSCLFLLSQLLQRSLKSEAQLEYTKERGGGTTQRGMKPPDIERDTIRVDVKVRRQWLGKRLEENEIKVKSDREYSAPNLHMRPDSKALKGESPLLASQSLSQGGISNKNKSISPTREGGSSELIPLWMQISNDLYSYSAFWDSRRGLPSGPVARVLGILKYNEELLQEPPVYRWSGVVKADKLKYSCFLWYMGQEAERGQLSAFIYEEGLKTFVGTYFLCSPENSTSYSPKSEHDNGKFPYAVSLVPHGMNATSRKLVYLSESNKRKQDIERHGSSAVCVRPLFGPFSDLSAMALFISYYFTVFNISHFYFYDFAIESNVKEYMIQLTADGDVVIHLLPWNIPKSEWEELWDLGSLTALNDCVYRASGAHSHVAIVDLDEFIVPRLPVTTLEQLYTAVIKHKHGSEGDAVLILNAFFCSEFQDQTFNGSNEFPLFEATLREPRLWPSKSRSKMVVVPQTVLNVGHHMVHGFLQPTFKNQASPKLVSVMHHYRACAGMRAGIHATGSEVLKQSPIRDKAMLKYKRAVLASRTMQLYQHLIQNAL